MRASAVPLCHKLISLVVTGLLTCGLLPTLALADDSQDDSVAASFVLADNEGSGEAATPNPAASTDDAEGLTLASRLAGSTASIVSADVALDAADPVIGSFTIDGFTYAVGSDGLTLVAVDPAAVADGAIAIPASVTFNDVTYPVTAIGSYAFYLSGATSVDLPDSILSVDDRAFRSSDVGAVSVDPGNPNYASFDGALCSADKTRLLLIPEGRKGSVLLSCETEVVEASLFSHCSLVDAISVEEGGAAFSSWNGLLYDASGQTLLRVPAGATDITIRDGCMAIAAGAMEGCAKLERINAPATVTSISPDLFESVPTIALPAQSALHDEASSGVASSLLDQVNDSTNFIPQLTAMVPLPFINNGLPKVTPSAIEVNLTNDVSNFAWQTVGFTVRNNVADRKAEGASLATLQSGSTYQLAYLNFHFAPGTALNYGTYLGTSQSSVLNQGTSFKASGNHATIGWAYAYYDASLGWYVRRETNPQYFWITGAKVKSVSTSPFGASLAHGTSVAGCDVYFRVHDVVAYTWNANGGCWQDSNGSASESRVSYTSIDYEQYASAPDVDKLVRSGYILRGWAEDETTSWVDLPAEATKVPSSDQNKILYAVWEPVVSVDVPLDVVAKVDKQGAESQQEAQGYIESRCGEPLVVTDVKFEPLAGASTMFGADAGSVLLQACAGDDANPFMSYTLDVAAVESDADALAPLSMTAYGDRIPIRYRFDVPDALIPTLAEATEPVCTVSYTVALASAAA